MRRPETNVRSQILILAGKTVPAKAGFLTASGQDSSPDTLNQRDRLSGEGLRPARGLCDLRAADPLEEGV
jgi:hypothetical protein